jgi:hypothetical protein
MLNNTGRYLWSKFSGGMAFAVLVGCLVIAPSLARAQLFPSLTTGRGCLENGDDATYAVGDGIVISFRIESNTHQPAQATLFDFLPNGFVNVFELGTVPTNATQQFTGVVGPPTGIKQLQLQARETNTPTAFALCSFRTVGQNPSGTATPTPTQTPFITRTPTPTVSPPSAPDLHPGITTDRGCTETGQHPVFAVGERILLTVRIDSQTFATARATLFDFPSSGFVNVFDLGTLFTNRGYTVVAGIALPTGVERVQLRAQNGGLSTFSNTCSFVVVSSAATPTMTGTFGQTRTPTITNSPQPTRTPTSTATATSTRTAAATFPPTRTPTITATPGGAPDVSPSITTSLGCIETGQNPAFTVGDSITLIFRAQSQTVQNVQATIADFLANGFVNVFELGTIPTNQTSALVGRIAPPTGTESVQLRVRAPNGPTALSNTCSFRVTTFTSATPSRTPTRSATPTITPTATPTRTATPL